VQTTYALPEDALVVSFNPERNSRELTEHVVEIRETTLDARDMIDTTTGQFDRDRISKAKAQ
jgi:hypothetical protein